MAEKKRYHESKRDRMDESRGMERHIRNDHTHEMHMRAEDRYAGEHSRRRQEMEDAGMIQEDRRAVANLPQEVMYKPYPSNRDYLDGDLDDTIRGVDHQIEVLDGRKRDKTAMAKKF